MKHPACGVLLISGVPGAGKTTVSCLLATRLARSALLHGDDIHNLVVSGRTHPNEEPPDEAERQLVLRDRNLSALIDNFVEAGFLTVLDDVFVSQVRLTRLLSLLKSRPAFMAILAPDLSVVRERDRSRPEKTVFSIWSHLDEMMRSEMKGVGCWIDSSTQTAEETAAEVLARVWSEGVIAS